MFPGRKASCGTRAFATTRPASASPSATSSASGISLYGNYDLNRGDASEADTYYLSASRSFGKLAWSLSFANFYNGVRFDADGTPQVVRIELPDQQTFSSDWFLAVNRTLAVALDYSYVRQPGYGGHQFFVRLILRK